MPEPLICLCRDLSSMAIEHLRNDCLGPPLEVQFACADSFMVQAHIGAIRRRTFRPSRRKVQEEILPAGSITVEALYEGWTEQILSPCERVTFCIPAASLQAFADAAGRSEFARLLCPDGAQDDTLHGLAQAVIPGLQGAKGTSCAFLDQMGFAVMTHLLRTYGGLHFPSQGECGLAAWQEIRAVEILRANFSQKLCLGDLADACGLSRSYFGKAFARSFGKSPFRWVLECKVARARDLLRSDMPIVDIAQSCGFADQSHLTRAFADLMHVTPAAWRRAYRQFSGAPVAGKPPSMGAGTARSAPPCATC